MHNNAFYLPFIFSSSLFFPLFACLSFSLFFLIVYLPFVLSFFLISSSLNIQFSSQHLQLSALGFDFLSQRGSWRSCCHISNYPPPSSVLSTLCLSRVSWHINYIKILEERSIQSHCAFIFNKDLINYIQPCSWPHWIHFPRSICWSNYLDLKNK